DWSSDVCSSDLSHLPGGQAAKLLVGEHQRALHFAKHPQRPCGGIETGHGPFVQDGPALGDGLPGRNALALWRQRRHLQGERQGSRPCAMALLAGTCPYYITRGSVLAMRSA